MTIPISTRGLAVRCKVCGAPVKRGDGHWLRVHRKESNHLRTISTNLERDRAIYARYTAGETLQQLGDAYGISRERVRQILERHSRRFNLPKPKRPPRPRLHVCAICGESYEGLTVTSGNNAFNKRARQAHIEASHPFLRRAGGYFERNRDIVARYVAGERPVDIARSYGMGPEMLYPVLRAAGVALHQPNKNSRRRLDAQAADGLTYNAR